MLPKRRAPYPIQAPLTSLIDIIFMLLIYFMLTANFITEEGIKIKLPRASAAKARVDKVVTIQVDESGQVSMDGVKVPEGALFSRIKARMSKGEKNVVIKADRDVPLDRAVKVMDTAKAAGAKSLSLATERDIR